MKKLFDVSTQQNTPQFIALEEGLLVGVAHRQLELERQFRHGQTDQQHEGHDLTITTRLVGQVLEISWKSKSPLSELGKLRGYRKEGGFCADLFPLENNGVCVVESRSDNSVVQNLSCGVDYYFTFGIVNGHKESLTVTDTIRFSVRVPTREEISRVDNLIAHIQVPREPESQISPKTKDALKELLSFVEFDENVSQLEKQLVDRISNKDYSDDEKTEKIERLKAVVESLRVQNS